ncbi:MAG: M28 family peptidase [Planctomycetes bacterium]|nr:M28 family peptidase [Planctomycetota bacterium]
MLKALIESAGKAYQAARQRELLAALWEQERWFDTPRQRAAAEFARDAFAAAGLADARLDPYLCDGRTRYQDWTTHVAWDCPSARLATEEGLVLADRAECPCAVVAWSGPLGSASAPAIGEVVDADALATLTPEAVEGKFVLTARYPLEGKHRLLGMKPLALVSDFLGEGPGYTPDTTKWCNTWSDGPYGWYFHADDQVMPGFVLSPAKGRVLRERLAADPRLRIAGFCDAQLYDGHGQNVTAVLEGRDPSREVWLFGHAAEQGAHDNASGVAAIIEAMTLLAELIAAGALPRPRHSIRAILTEECIGMLAFAMANEGLRRRALAGLNLDGVGDEATAARPFAVHYGPLSNPGFGWAVGALIAHALQEQAGDAWHVLTKRFVPTADDMIADPACGIPAIWLGKTGPARGYHSSADTPEVCDPASLRHSTLFAAAWAYAMASLDDALAERRIGPAAAWVEREVARVGHGGVHELRHGPSTPGPPEGAPRDDAGLLDRRAAAGVLRDLARWGVSEGVWEPAAARFAPRDAEPLPGLPSEGPVYRRTVWGTCTCETLPRERRMGLFPWSRWLTSGLYWCDGRRPLAAVERLARAETGTPADTGLAEPFDRCVEAGTMLKRAR